MPNLWQSVQGFRSSDTPNFAILHRLSWSLLQQCKHCVVHCDYVRIFCVFDTRVGYLIDTADRRNLTLVQSNLYFPHTASLFRGVNLFSATQGCVWGRRPLLRWTALSSTEKSPHATLSCFGLRKSNKLSASGGFAPTLCPGAVPIYTAESTASEPVTSSRSALAIRPLDKLLDLSLQFVFRSKAKWKRT